MSSHSPQPARPDSPSVTDAQVARWQAGDEAAFDILFERFAPLIGLRVRRAASWGALKDRLQLEDVVQEIWLKVVPGARRTFTPGGAGSFLAFVSKVADNTAIDLVRRQRAIKRGEGQAEVPLVPGEEPGILAGGREFETPTSSARRSELREIAARELNQREYLAWDLVEIQTYTASEAGLAMDISGAAVRGLLMRARAKLVLALRHGQPEE